jgi:DNA-binding NarL/FixJ family response regulator
MARPKVRIHRFQHQGEELLVCSYPVARRGWLARLTPAELAVAEGVLEGLTARQIAQRRRVSERTVGNQLAHIYEKLGVASRYELVALVSREAGRG